jgi:Predicted hydrolase (HAD superfamily)
MALTIHVPFEAILWGFEGVLNAAKPPEITPAPRVLEISERANLRGLRQAILTDADAARADEIEARLPDFPHIEALFAAGRTGHAKPSPEAFAAATEGLGLPAAAILYVDGSGAFCNAAAKLGFRTFRFTRLAVDNLEARLPPLRRGR